MFVSLIPSFYSNLRRQRPPQTALSKNTLLLIFYLSNRIIYNSFLNTLNNTNIDSPIFYDIMYFWFHLIFFCRDNAVYRSNSFKFERRGPAPPETEVARVQSRVPGHVAPLDSQVQRNSKNNKKIYRRITKEVIFSIFFGIWTACHRVDLGIFGYQRLNYDNNQHQWPQPIQI